MSKSKNLSWGLWIAGIATFVGTSANAWADLRDAQRLEHEARRVEEIVAVSGLHYGARDAANALLRSSADLLDCERRVIGIHRSDSLCSHITRQIRADLQRLEISVRSVGYGGYGRDRVSTAIAELRIVLEDIERREQVEIRERPRFEPRQRPMPMRNLVVRGQMNGFQFRFEGRQSIQILNQCRRFIAELRLGYIHDLRLHYERGVATGSIARTCNLIAQRAR